MQARSVLSCVSLLSSVRVAVLAGLMALAIAWVSTASAKAAPEITKFKATPTKLSAGGGEVRLSAQLPAGATCQVIATPSYDGLPAPFPCGPSTSWLVSAPPNTSTGTVTYRYSLQATYPLSTITSKASIPVSESSAPAVTYVALGDSFSSGEGNPGKPPKEWLDRAGKATAVDNGCHRSPIAYPVKIESWLKSSATQAALGLPAMSLDFLSCSGARTEDLWNSGAHGAPYYLTGGENREWQQMQDTRDLANARIVTVMVGGDDLNFGDILYNCISLSHSCNASSDDGWIADLQQNIATLKPLLVKTYEKVAALAKNAAVYVVGYPDMFPPATDQQRLGECASATITPVGLIGAQEAKYLTERQSELTSVVKAAAAAANVYYIDPNAPGNFSFGGHDVCEPTGSWFNKPNVLDTEYSFHPNAAGQKALTEDVKAAIRGNVAPSQRWTTATLPLPAGADPNSTVSVLGVTCASESFCIAGGKFSEPATLSVAHPLIDAWDGTRWTNQTAPAGIAALTSVSCGMPSQCVAVGELSGGSRAASSVIWNGSGWTAHAMPIPPNVLPEVSIESVSCASTGYCEAVGTGGQNVAPGMVPIAEQWNGSAWVAQAAATPQEDAWLYGVSCSAATYCVAVGQQAKPFAWEALAEIWNGSTWAEVSTPSVSSNFGRLFGVSCTTETSCTAVGARGAGYEGEPACPITELWDGSNWKLDIPPTCTGPTANVSCWAATGCLANFSGDEAYEWNGAAWTTEVTGLLATGGGPLSCPSATFCVASASSGRTIYLRR